MAGSKKPRTNWKVGGNIIPQYVLHAITWYPPLSSYSISSVKMAHWIMLKRLHSISKLSIFGEFYTWIWKSRLTYFKVHFPCKFASHIVSPSSWITSGPRWQMVCNASTPLSEHLPVCERAWWEFCWVGQMKTDWLGNIGDISIDFNKFVWQKIAHLSTNLFNGFWKNDLTR